MRANDRPRVLTLALMTTASVGLGGFFAIAHAVLPGKTQITVAAHSSGTEEASALNAATDSPSIAPATVAPAAQHPRKTELAIGHAVDRSFHTRPTLSADQAAPPRLIPNERPRASLTLRRPDNAIERDTAPFSLALAAAPQHGAVFETAEEMTRATASPETTTAEPLMPTPIVLSIPPAPGKPQRSSGVTAAALTDALSIPVEPMRRQVTLRQGDTLVGVLRRGGIDYDEAQRLIAAMHPHLDPRRLSTGLDFVFEFDRQEDGAARLARLVTRFDQRADLHITRQGESGYSAEIVAKPTISEIAMTDGTIDGSLFAAGARAGLEDEVLHAMLGLFSWDVDFARDIHDGDRFEVVYRRETLQDGTFIDVESIDYARLQTGGRDLEAFRFIAADGRADYFTREGKTVRKSLMRTPIDGARLSSGYGMRRHPILGFERMHQGVDFAAPSGTPVYAAGDGRIETAGRNGGYGNYVRMRHNGEYATAYAHLSKFAPGLKRGMRVEQGDVIGYVGSTGRSTGPHLHFEVIHRGKPINPMEAEQVNLAALTGAEKRAFLDVVAEIDSLRRTVPLQNGIRVAALDGAATTAR